MHIGRNPDAGFPDGDRKKGYIVQAPIGSDGILNQEIWKENKDKCIVIRYSDDDSKDADGLLVFKKGNWYFEYDEPHEGPEEGLHRLGEHRLWVGDYVTIYEHNGSHLTYIVSETN